MTKAPLIDRETKYTVTLISRECLPPSAASKTGVVIALNYNRETDEPAFQRAWEIVKEKRALGQVKAIPARPAGGIRLRGSRAKLPA